MQIHSVNITGIRSLLRRAETLELSRGAIQKLKWLLFATTHGGNVSLTCRHFGISRSTFLRWAERFDPANPLTLCEQSRRPHAVRAPETDTRVIALIKSLRQKQPLLGKEHISALLHTMHGIEISPSTVGRVIARYKLFFADTAAHRNKRLANDASSSTSTTNEDSDATANHEGLSPDPFFFPASRLAPQS